MAAVAGYQTIGPDGGEKPAVNGGTSVQDRLGAAARSAGSVAVGARDAVAELLTGPMPAVAVYTEPLDPGAPLTLRDRVGLVWESCRDWRDFFDWRACNIPPAAEVKLRYGANFETFFYNYLVIAVINLAISSVFHIWAGIKVALVVAVAVVFYVVHPEPIVLGAVTLDEQEKRLALAAIAAFMLLFGGVFSFLIGGVFFGAMVFAVHGLLREHREEVTASAI